MTMAKRFQATGIFNGKAKKRLIIKISLFYYQSQK